MRGGGVGGLLEKDSQRETIFHSLSVAGGSRQQMTGGEREGERVAVARVLDHPKMASAKETAREGEDARSDAGACVRGCECRRKEAQINQTTTGETGTERAYANIAKRIRRNVSLPASCPAAAASAAAACFGCRSSQEIFHYSENSPILLRQSNDGAKRTTTLVRSERRRRRRREQRQLCVLRGSFA